MKLPIEVSAVAPSQVLALRQSVLRPGRALEEAIFEGDDEASSLHAAAFAEGSIIGVASLFRRPFPFERALSWQLRGMAVAPEHQGQGVGRALLRFCEEYVVREGGLLWCNARTSAVGFYEANGFEIRGEEFEIAGVGPHFVMACRIERAST